MAAARKKSESRKKKETPLTERQKVTKHSTMLKDWTEVVNDLNISKKGWEKKLKVQLKKGDDELEGLVRSIDNLDALEGNVAELSDLMSDRDAAKRAWENTKQEKTPLLESPEHASTMVQSAESVKAISGHAKKIRAIARDDVERKADLFNLKKAADEISKQAEGNMEKAVKIAKKVPGLRPLAKKIENDFEAAKLSLKAAVHKAREEFEERPFPTTAKKLQEEGEFEIARGKKGRGERYLRAAQKEEQQDKLEKKITALEDEIESEPRGYIKLQLEKELQGLKQSNALAKRNVERLLQSVSSEAPKPTKKAMSRKERRKLFKKESTDGRAGDVGRFEKVRDQSKQRLAEINQLLHRDVPPHKLEKELKHQLPGYDLEKEIGLIRKRFASTRIGPGEAKKPHEFVGGLGFRDSKDQKVRFSSLQAIQNYLNTAKSALAERDRGGNSFMRAIKNPRSYIFLPFLFQPSIERSKLKSDLKKAKQALRAYHENQIKWEAKKGRPTKLSLYEARAQELEDLFKKEKQAIKHFEEVSKRFKELDKTLGSKNIALSSGMLKLIRDPRANEDLLETEILKLSPEGARPSRTVLDNLYESTAELQTWLGEEDRLAQAKIFDEVGGEAASPQRLEQEKRQAERLEQNQRIFETFKEPRAIVLEIIKNYSPSSADDERITGPLIDHIRELLRDASDADTLSKFRLSYRLPRSTELFLAIRALVWHISEEQPKAAKKLDYKTLGEGLGVDTENGPADHAAWRKNGEAWFDKKIKDRKYYSKKVKAFTELYEYAGPDIVKEDLKKLKDSVKNFNDWMPFSGENAAKKKGILDAAIAISRRDNDGLFNPYDPSKRGIKELLELARSMHQVDYIYVAWRIEPAKPAPRTWGDAARGPAGAEGDEEGEAEGAEGDEEGEAEGAEGGEEGEEAEEGEEGLEGGEVEDETEEEEEESGRDWGGEGEDESGEEGEEEGAFAVEDVIEGEGEEKGKRYYGLEDKIVTEEEDEEDWDEDDDEEEDVVEDEEEGGRDRWGVEEEITDELNPPPEPPPSGGPPSEPPSAPPSVEPGQAPASTERTATKEANQTTEQISDLGEQFRNGTLNGQQLRAILMGMKNLEQHVKSKFRNDYMNAKSETDKTYDFMILNYFLSRLEKELIGGNPRVKDNDSLKKLHLVNLALGGIYQEEKVYVNQFIESNKFTSEVLDYTDKSKYSHLDRVTMMMKYYYAGIISRGTASSFCVEILNDDAPGLETRLQEETRENKNYNFLMNTFRKFEKYMKSMRGPQSAPPGQRMPIDQGVAAAKNKKEKSGDDDDTTAAAVVLTE